MSSKEYCSKQFLGTCEYLKDVQGNFDALVKVSANKRNLRNESLVRDLNKWRKEAKESQQIQAQLEARVFAARSILTQIHKNLKSSPQPQDMNVRFSALYLDQLDEALNAQINENKPMEGKE